MVNNVVTFFFFLENAENLGRSDDAKRRKKERIALDRPRWHAKRKAIKRQIKLVLLLKLLQQLHETRHLREVIRSLSKRLTHYSGSWSFFKYKIIIKFPCKSKLIKFFILRLERTLWIKLTFYKIISFRQGELIIPFLRKVHIILGNPGSVGAGHRGEIFKRKT